MPSIPMNVACRELEISAEVDDFEAVGATVDTVV
jgi:hypothetical protein